MIHCLSPMIWWYGVLAISVNHYVTYASWISFAASSNYTDLRTVTELDDYFTPRNISKGMSLISARLDCSRSCVMEEACHAFNLYETQRFYVCEMLPENFCKNETSNRVISRNGSVTWDKLKSGTKLSCLDQILSSGVPNTCEKVRPGCLGTWPNCSKCIKSCIECYQRYAYAGYRNCTLWPDGDDPTSVPIFSLCYNNTHILIKRQFTLTLKKFTQDYKFSFQTIHRVFSLNQYSRLRFTFVGKYGKVYIAEYKISSIDADGTLRKLSYVSGLADIFKLKGLTLNATAFVTVSSDVYGCGSFWLIEPRNATYCPGGYTKMFGTPKVTHDPIVTGLHFSVGYSTIIFVSAEISLLP